MNINEIILNLEIMSHHKNLVEKAVQNYAAAINEGDIEKILSYYSEEGIFMPDSIKTLKRNQIGNMKLIRFSKMDFKIQFSDIRIKVEDNYAFVEAVAQTSEENQQTKDLIRKESRDFFVFKKEQNDWKIFRYIFNTINEINF